MQTFLPNSDFKTSVKCLDNMRLGKQRVEAMQILNALLYGKGWVNHPATKMWKGYEPALMYYHDLAIQEWVCRGFNNTMTEYEPDVLTIIYPPWFGNEDFHKSHQSNLMRKADEALVKSKVLFNNGQVGRALQYQRVFHWYTDIAKEYNWTLNTKLPYIWPV